MYGACHCHEARATAVNFVGVDRNGDVIVVLTNTKGHKQIASCKTKGGEMLNAVETALHYAASKVRF